MPRRIAFLVKEKKTDILILLNEWQRICNATFCKKTWYSFIHNGKGLKEKVGGVGRKPPINSNSVVVLHPNFRSAKQHRAP